jgi:hypothetical protein
MHDTCGTVLDGHRRCKPYTQYMHTCTKESALTCEITQLQPILEYRILSHLSHVVTWKMAVLKWMGRESHDRTPTHVFRHWILLPCTKMQQLLCTVRTANITNPSLNFHIIFYIHISERIWYQKVEVPLVFTSNKRSMCKIQYLQLLVLISGVDKTRTQPGRQSRGHADRYATGIVCARCSIAVC